MSAELAVVYVEFRGTRPPLAWWRGRLLAPDDAVNRQSLTRFMARLVRSAKFDRTLPAGRVVRLRRSMLTETDIGTDPVTGHRMRAALVTFGVGRQPGWAAEPAAEAVKILAEGGIRWDAAALQSVLEGCQARSAPFFRRLLARLWRWISPRLPRAEAKQS